MPLEELEFDHNIFSNRHAADDKLLVRFFKDVLPDEERSVAEGRRCFRETDFVQIMVPGDKRNVTIREARPEDKSRFSKQFAAFSAGDGDKIDGYPLKEWPLANRAMVEELKYLGFLTVEHVANVNDSVAGKLPGMRELQQRAKNWLAAQESAAPMEKLQNELKARDEAQAAMQAEIDEMRKALAELKKK